MLEIPFCQKMSLYSAYNVSEDCSHVVNSCINRLRSATNCTELSHEEIKKLEELSICVRENTGVKQTQTKHNYVYATPIGNLLCPFCCSVMENAESLAQHLGQKKCRRSFEMPRTPFLLSWRQMKCTACKKDFPEYALFEEHCQEHNKEKLLMFCTICNFAFPMSQNHFHHHNKSILHSRNFNKLNSLVRESFLFVIQMFNIRCNVCKLNLTKETVSLHIRRCHQNGASNFLAWCQVCDIMMSAEDAQSHILNNRHADLPWYPILCVLCGEECVGGSTFVRHIDTSCPNVSLYRTTSPLNSEKSSDYGLDNRNFIESLMLRHKGFQNLINELPSNVRSANEQAISQTDPHATLTVFEKEMEMLTSYDFESRASKIDDFGRMRTRKSVRPDSPVRPNRYTMGVRRPSNLISSPKKQPSFSSSTAATPNADFTQTSNPNRTPYNQSPFNSSTATTPIADFTQTSNPNRTPYNQSPFSSSPATTKQATPKPKETSCVIA